jgi:hypothetical protein
LDADANRSDPEKCIPRIRQANQYQTVRFEDVRYSMPRHVAFEPVTVIGTVANSANFRRASIQMH